MYQLANQHTPARLEGTPPTTGHRAFSALTRVTLVALLGNALAYTAYQLSSILFSQGFVPQFFVGSIPAILAAGLVATRWRWTPAVGAALVLITSTIFFSFPLLQYHLTHPGYNPAYFIAGVLSQACAASSTITGEPTVHMGAVNFVQNVVLVPKGSKLLIVNDTHVEHLLQNGSWTSSGTVVTTAEPGAPVLHNLDSTGGSLEIGPFNRAGIFHIYCSIHTGMNLTIVVQ